jgi:hypothetical protein
MRVADLLDAKAGYNPRRISAHDADRLRASLERFGVVEPIVWNRRSGTVVGGHQRIDAAAALQLEELPVCVVDLDPAEERVLNVALNRIAGDWDHEALSRMLQDLAVDQTDLLDLTGFEGYELEPLLAADWRPPDVDESVVVGHDGSTKHGVHFNADQWKVVGALIERVRALRKEPGLSKSSCIAVAADEYLRRHAPRAGKGRRA